MVEGVASHVARVRALKRIATQHLLGETIAISDDDWTAPIALAGWTRGHVATHLSRGSDLMAEVVSAAVGGRAIPCKPSETTQRHALEEGARRSALDLQINLDTSSSRLNHALDQVPPDLWATVIDSPWGRLPLADLPTLRLLEIVIHRVDLDTGYTFAALDDDAAALLLEAYARRHARAVGRPRIRVEAPTGFSAAFGSPEAAEVVVTGTCAQLLGWLCGRLDRTAVEGAEHVRIGSAT